MTDARAVCTYLDRHAAVPPATHRLALAPGCKCAPTERPVCAGCGRAFVRGFKAQVARVDVVSSGVIRCSGCGELAVMDESHVSLTALADAT